MENKKIKPSRFILPAAILVILLYLAFTSFFTVGETERAVVTTFGKVTSVCEAGLHFKLPYPIQSAKMVNMTTRRLTVGYELTPNGETVDLDESTMITGDYNVVCIDFFIEWKVSDARKFLYNSKNPEMILKNISQAAARDVVGMKTVDEVLTTGKVSIQSEIKANIVEQLEKLDIGIQLAEVKIQDAEPPTNEVIQAFKSVETAKQQKETTINVAKAYENSVLPDAEARADKIIKEAEAYREERINQAKGTTAGFLAMFSEYTETPEITKKRLYLEMIEKVLPGVDVYIDSSDGSLDKIVIVDTKGGKN